MTDAQKLDLAKALRRLAADETREFRRSTALGETALGLACVIEKRIVLARGLRRTLLARGVVPIEKKKASGDR